MLWWMANSPKNTIVEDNAPIREMYKLKLIAKGYDVSTANNGTSALQY